MLPPAEKRSDEEQGNDAGNYKEYGNDDVHFMFLRSGFRS